MVEPSKKEHVVRVDDVKPWIGTPTSHPKSKWRILLTEDTVGAKRLVVAHVELEPGGYTEPGAHEEFEQAFYFLEGEGVMMVDGKEYVAKPGMAVHVPLNTTHCYKNTSNAPLHFLVIESQPYSKEWIQKE